MNALAPVWAAGWDEIIPVVLGILFILVPAIVQLLAKGRQPQQGGGQPRPPQLQDEIGEFLRRAARNRAQGQARQQGPAAGQARKPVQPAGRPTPARPAPAKRPVQQPVNAEVLQPKPMKPDELAKRIAKDMDTSRLERHARELGQRVAGADQKIEQRRHQLFEHNVGQLAATSSPAPQPDQLEDEGFPRTSAAGLAVLLGDVQSLRQAILLNEILRRPEERWR